MEQKDFIEKINCDPNLDYRLIPLTQGKFALIDAEDYQRVSLHKWHAHRINGRYYACSMLSRRNVPMHRLIKDIPEGFVCDHINHITLDNRRCNLRICTPAQNSRNRLPSGKGTSVYKGVRRSHHGKWKAQICYENRLIHIGYYDFEQDAAIAYDDMAIELFGQFACLNFHYRPEIKQWLEECYLFFPMSPESLSDKSEKIPREIQNIFL
ncbi:AP2/ERF family transcription factor [Planctomycetota bacterium]